ncbi:MAG: Uncharacterized protein G01um10147_85 [Microgenomates group bacterium Gr01-1014_7]|nr:MAG: Uncharacterized protein G01um10147_85 [Microgenomates group bacterium Gr01-1014_7]
MIALKILTVGVIIYLVWSFTHHKRDKSLTLVIFLEYLLTAALVLILLMGVLI